MNYLSTNSQQPGQPIPPHRMTRTNVTGYLNPKSHPDSAKTDNKLFHFKNKTSPLYKFNLEKIKESTWVPILKHCVHNLKITNLGKITPEKQSSNWFVPHWLEITFISICHFFGSSLLDSPKVLELFICTSFLFLNPMTFTIWRAPNTDSIMYMIVHVAFSY